MAQQHEWTARYLIRSADPSTPELTQRDYAAEQARMAAKQDVPSASVNVLSVKRTPKGYYSVTVLRTRSATDTSAAPAAKTAAPKGRKENSDMATNKAPKTAPATPAAPAPEAPFVLPAPGTGRVTLQVQEALAAQGLRRCAGIKIMGHEQHDAPIAEFGKYSKGLLGLDMVCKTSWHAYNKARRDAAKADAPAKPPKAPKPEPIKTAKPRAAKAPTAKSVADAINGPMADDAAKPAAGTKAAAAAAARAQVRREAQAAAAAKRAARKAAAAPAPEPTPEPVVAAADGAADDLPF